MIKTILFVDDEPPILNSLKRVFRKSPHKTIFTTDTAEALEIVRTQAISVLVSDYSMPSMTGAELLAQAKHIRPEMTRIILSGNNDQEATIQAINKGSASKFLSKPWNNQNLISEIELAIARWESSQYVDKSKELLNQAAFYNCVNGLVDDMDDKKIAFVCFGIEDYEQLKMRCGIDRLKEVLVDLVPELSAQLPNTKTALMDDHYFCAFIDTRETDQTTDIKDTITNMLSLFDAFFYYDDQKIEFNWQTGYVFTENSERTNAELIERAMMAYKEAKSNSEENLVCFSKEMFEADLKKVRFEKNLNSALDNNEFLLHYQPKINVLDNTMRGAEALIRWNNQELGMVSPLDFIPLAENNKLINDIGQWVLNEAAKQWVNWYGDASSGVRSAISVNVSPVQLRDTSFIIKVEKCLMASGIDPANLELEITENIVIENTESAISTLKEIKKLGLKIAIDDFGTGYSSLSYLNKLPLDVMKIDRSFVKEMHESKEKADLVRNMITLGHDLGLEIVAEGVEDEQQLEVLREMKCDVIQGYFYSPPVDAQKFSELISRYPAPVQSEQSAMDTKAVGFQ